MNGRWKCPREFEAAYLALRNRNRKAHPCRTRTSSNGKSGIPSPLSTAKGWRVEREEIGALRKTRVARKQSRNCGPRLPCPRPHQAKRSGQFGTVKGYAPNRIYLMVYFVTALTADRRADRSETRTNYAQNRPARRSKSFASAASMSPPEPKARPMRKSHPPPWKTSPNGSTARPDSGSGSSVACRAYARQPGAVQAVTQEVSASVIAYRRAAEIILMQVECEAE